MNSLRLFTGIIILIFLGLYSCSDNLSAVKIPRPPSDLSATPVSPSQINLSWKDNSFNEDGFKVESNYGGISYYSEIASLPANSTSYNNEGLFSYTQYNYRIYAFNIKGNSTYANGNATTFSLNLTLPNPPSNFTATAVSNSEIYLTWSDNSDNENGFTIGQRGGSNDSMFEIANLVRNTTSYLVGGLTGTSTYSFHLHTYNSLGKSPNTLYGIQCSARTF